MQIMRGGDTFRANGEGSPGAHLSAFFHVGAREMTQRRRGGEAESAQPRRERERGGGAEGRRGRVLNGRTVSRRIPMGGHHSPTFSRSWHTTTTQSAQGVGKGRDSPIRWQNSLLGAKSKQRQLWLGLLF